MGILLLSHTLSLSAIRSLRGISPLSSTTSSVSAHAIRQAVAEPDGRGIRPNGFPPLPGTCPTHSFFAVKVVIRRHRGESKRDPPLQTGPRWMCNAASGFSSHLHSSAPPLQPTTWLARSSQSAETLTAQSVASAFPSAFLPGPLVLPLYG